MYFNSLRRKSQQLFVERFSPLLNILSIPFGTVHKAVFFVLFQSQNFIQQRIISTVIYYKPPQRTSIQVLIESSHSSSLKKKQGGKTRMSQKFSPATEKNPQPQLCLALKFSLLHHKLNYEEVCNKLRMFCVFQFEICSPSLHLPL